MKVDEKNIPGVFVVEPRVVGDKRGFFFESYSKERYAAYGIDIGFVQDNVSRSTKNVLRGLHYQKEQTQGKLVSVIDGCIFDVAVDIRLGSPTFGKWVGATLDDQAHQQFYVPPGFVHGFCVLSERADVLYKCTNYYHAASELVVRWDDPDIAIEWPIENPILSDKDRAGKFLRDIPKEQLPIFIA